MVTATSMSVAYVHDKSMACHDCQQTLRCEGMSPHRKSAGFLVDFFFSFAETFFHLKEKRKKEIEVDAEWELDEVRNQTPQWF